MRRLDLRPTREGGANDILGDLLGNATADLAPAPTFARNPGANIHANSTGSS